MCAFIIQSQTDILTMESTMRNAVCCVNERAREREEAKKSEIDEDAAMDERSLKHTRI